MRSRFNDKDENREVVSEYIAPKELARRWQCSRSSVDRIAKRAGMARVLLGEGRNGIVRYLRSEVDVYERSRMMRQGVRLWLMKLISSGRWMLWAGHLKGLFRCDASAVARNSAAVNYSLMKTVWCGSARVAIQAIR